LAGAVACALAGTGIAQAPQSRDYPPTYSSRKAPWYDPFGWFKSDAKKPSTASPKFDPSKPIVIDGGQIPGGFGSPPAWKWYGYGAPRPGSNPLGPHGSSPGAPSNWHNLAGATPGAIPFAGPTIGPLPFPQPSPGSAATAAPMRFADPVIIVPPASGPSLPTAVKPPATASTNDADRRSPANLGSPTMEPGSPANNRPHATIGLPVTAGTPVMPPAPRTPAEAVRPPGPVSPDIPVVPAPGIKMPPISQNPKSSESAIVARGRAPITEMADVIRRSSGNDLQILEICDAGPRKLVVRLAGPHHAARAFRDRLAQLPQLSGWRVDFELVTPLRY
jgi:hypothetical protein